MRQSYERWRSLGIEHLRSHPDDGYRKLMAKLGMPRDVALRVIGEARDQLGRAPKSTPISATTSREQDAKSRARKAIRSARSVTDLANAIDCSPREAERILCELEAEGLAIERNGDAFVAGVVRPGSSEICGHDIGEYDRHWSVIGATGDHHMGSHWERLDVVKTLYDIYEDEGVRAVYNTGNWIEGEARFNQLDVRVHGMSNQIDYWIENTPQKKGITTYFVAGDDHEGWYQKAMGVNIGKVAQDAARAAGRDDLVFLGYVEADIELRTPRGAKRMMRVMHPGGGSAYAHSYAPQKIVESFQGGEKPHILLIGHYHKFEYCYPREVHVIQTGCAVDQSIFMRKQKIQAMVGGCLLWINQADDGAINRVRAEWLPFYDRDFYAKRRNFNAAMRRAA